MLHIHDHYIVISLSLSFNLGILDVRRMINFGINVGLGTGKKNILLVFMSKYTWWL